MPETRSTNNKSTKKTSKTDSSPILMCTPEQCTDDQDKDFLKCDKCPRQVHYRCTRLPAYQIQLFVNSATKHYQFQCEKCVTVKQKLLELIQIGRDRILPKDRERNGEPPSRHQRLRKCHQGKNCERKRAEENFHQQKTQNLLISRTRCRITLVITLLNISRTSSRKNWKHSGTS